MFEQSPRVLQGLSVLLSRAAPVFASMTHFTFLIKKKDGEAASVFKQREKEVCGTSPCRWERGMRNVKQMSWSSALPEMAERRHPLMLVQKTGWRDNKLLRYLLAPTGCTTYLHTCPCVQCECTSTGLSCKIHIQIARTHVIHVSQCVYTCKDTSAWAQKSQRL